jgi:hypothetical protein
MFPDFLLTIVGCAGVCFNKERWGFAILKVSAAKNDGGKLTSKASTPHKIPKHNPALRGSPTTRPQDELKCDSCKPCNVFTQ